MCPFFPEAIFLVEVTQGDVRDLVTRAEYTVGRFALTLIKSRDLYVELSVGKVLANTPEDIHDDDTFTTSRWSFSDPVFVVVNDLRL
jgi:hypothetical protein